MWSAARAASRLSAVEHQLRSTEHLELVARVDFSPREINESVPALALHCRSAKIDLFAAFDHIDINIPAGFGAIGTHDRTRIAPLLDSHVDARIIDPAGRQNTLPGRL